MTGTFDFWLNLIVPEHIQFKLGAISATLAGTATDLPHYYVLRAWQGQTMQVNLTSVQEEAGLSIYQLQGATFLYARETDGNHYAGVLRANGEYVIMIAPAQACKRIIGCR